MLTTGVKTKSAMAALLKSENIGLGLPKIGQIIEGKIVAAKPRRMFIDLGQWGTGVVMGKELMQAGSAVKRLKTGDVIPVVVLDPDNEENLIELSLEEAGEGKIWENLTKKKQEGEIVTIKISAANKGGLMTEFEDIEGFLPVSQLSTTHYPRVEGGEKTKILEELNVFVGQEFQVKIIDVDKKTKKLIFSEKAVESNAIREALKKLKKGDVVEGTISGIVPFGAFIKFDGNLEGLIHISELDWQIVEDPREIVSVGDKIKAAIAEITGDRVSLSIKALKEDPWEKIEDKYKKGDLVSGKILKFNQYGAFVRVGEEINGLTHISSFASREEMEKMLSVGTSHEFEIETFEPKNHKMTLRPINKKQKGPNKKTEEKKEKIQSPLPLGGESAK